MIPETHTVDHMFAAHSIRSNQHPAKVQQLKQRRMLKEQAISRLQREIAEIDRLLYEAED